MVVQQSHQNAVRVREIVALAAKLVGPFLAVEKIVAQPPNDHQQTQHPVTWVIICAFDDYLHELWVVRRAKIEKREVAGQSPIGEVTSPKVGKFRVVEICLKLTVRCPAINLFPYTVGTSVIAHDLCFEKTPEKSKVKDDASL